jgi:signal transduction histidine kinase
VQQSLDLSETLTDALSQASALAGEQHIRIEAQHMPTGRVHVMGDAQRLCQLLLLLLDNAVRYSHSAGRIVLQWWVGDETMPTLVLQVSDEGIGIPAEELHQVFERHFRGENARVHRAAGSGLGLPIAKALAQAHGGSLTLESPIDEATGTGTRVQLRLPLLPCSAASAPGCAPGCAPGGVPVGVPVGAPAESNPAQRRQ